MYKKIINPETGRAVNVNGRIGKSVLRRYISNNNLNGGGIFDFITGTPSSDNPMEEINFMQGKISEALQLAEAKQNEWNSLNLVQTTKESEIRLLRESIAELVKKQNRLAEHTPKLENKKLEKNQIDSEVENCKQQLAQNEERCKSLESTKQDSDSKFEKWLDETSSKISQITPQVQAIIDQINETDERLKQESQQNIELSSLQTNQGMTNVDQFRQNYVSDDTRYGNTGYGSIGYGSPYNQYDNQYGNQYSNPYGSQYGGTKKNTKKGKKLPKNNRKNKSNKKK
tara:strand:+ start:1051 stop:1905 length:855 start_codon:yes stop_codon:yes gene_type:complete